MAKKLRRGFRKEAEEYAEEFRAELGLAAHAPLSAFGLAALLEVPVTPLSAHPAVPEEVKAHFRDGGNSRFSATSLGDGTYREILHNDYQHPNRQNSNVMHELSHIILGHPPHPPMLDDGCRHFDVEAELEANQLGFTILVPKRAALFALEAFRDRQAAADYFGVSLPLLQHRIQITDVAGWAKNRTRR